MIKNWTKFKPKIKQIIALALCVAMLTPTVTQALHFDESQYSMIFIRKGWEPEIENLGEQKELHILKSA